MNVLARAGLGALLLHAGAAMAQAPAAADTRGQVWTRAAPAPAPPTVSASRLDDADWRAASVAFDYFQNQIDPRSGLVRAVQGYPNATIWDLASLLAGLVCAVELGLGERQALLARIDELLLRLQKLPLYRDELPSREYRLSDLSPLDLDGRPDRDGSGWSALDIGRLLIWLRITAIRLPQFAPRTEAIVARWDFRRAITGGQLYGVLRTSKGEQWRQEGRLGYEQYAAAGFALWGHRAETALRVPEAAAAIEFAGIRLPLDPRPPPAFTSDPFYLAALEGVAEPLQGELQQRVYRVQQAQGEQAEVPYALGEDAIDRAPWFLYNNLYANGRWWLATDHRGAAVERRQQFSAKAAYAAAVLHEGPYAARLRETALRLARPGRGFIAGIYEDGSLNSVLNINTQAGILTALCYRARGGALLH